MRVLVTGCKGQLGYDVAKQLTKRGDTPIAVDIEEMDITDKASVDKYITDAQVDAVIHCAAYTAVDNAEDNVDLCRRINRDGTQNIADVCKKLNIKMIYISTDYVFDGNGENFWEPDEERHPLNVYGMTKYEGELAVENTVDKYFIVRISWVFGLNGKNFVRTMLGLGKTHDKLTVVADQIGSPTYTADLAALLCEMVHSERYGRYHATNEGICSWYEFTKEIMTQAGEYYPEYLNVEVSPVGSDAYPAKAKRPSNSRMSKDKLTENGFERLPAWQDALKRYIKELKDNGQF
ncbi:MAG: dTDP-4-dehydrorhamnose reductase [Ruminococcus sp.]|nr:dTDP-4-dehydrorhamnose reductase [Ruminococcus sp.]